MGTVNSGLFTSTTDEWPTPDDLFDKLDQEFHFTLDPCATAENAKCPRYYTKAVDGLTQPWPGVVYPMTRAEQAAQDYREFEAEQYAAWKADQ